MHLKRRLAGRLTILKPDHGVVQGGEGRRNGQTTLSSRVARLLLVVIIDGYVRVRGIVEAILHVQDMHIGLGLRRQVLPCQRSATAGRMGRHALA